MSQQFLWVLGLMALFPSVNLEGSPSQNTLNPQRLDAIFEDVEDRGGPGYSVAVVQAGKIQLLKGYGLANLDHTIPLKPDSVFNIASLSKQFTAAAIALLVLEGRLSLEDTLADHLEAVPEAYREVTVAHLVYMTSGIPEYYHQERPGGRSWYRDYFEVADAVEASLAQPPDFKPGDQWSYSNVSYMLLTQIVESVTKQKFSDFLKQRVFDPLSMKNTHVNDDVSRIVRDRVTGYNLRDGGGYHQHLRHSPHYGGSGVFSSAEDLAQWDLSLRNHTLGGPDLTRLLLSTRAFNHDKKNDAFGLVWGEYEGHRTLWYEGGDSGFSSFQIRFPDDDFTVIVLSNLGTGRAADRARKVASILLGQ